MNAVWKRIHTWLGANAPAGYGRLRRGADAEAIRAAEEAMGLNLPGDVKASCRIHDGQDNEPGLIGGEGWRLWSLQEVVEQRDSWSRADPKAARLVPIAENAMGDRVFLNLDPDVEGSGSLMIQRRDSAELDPLVPSFRSWIEGFADRLEDDEFTYSEDEGCLMHIDEIDLD